MTVDANIHTRYENARAALESRKQGHVLTWWDELDVAARETLLSDIESIPWEVVDPLVQSHVLRKPHRTVPTDVKPPEVFRQPPPPERRELYDRARSRGVEMIRGGKVAALTVAGGQASRLGIDGPKGTVAVTPVTGRTLFQVFAEMLQAARSRYEAAIPWYIMTSAGNHKATVEYFQRHEFFALPREDVFFFTQGMLPVFDFQGRLLLDDKSRLAKAPDGHGGVLKALAESGALADMQRRSIDVITYFQVDNPLVKPFDPLFIGLHAATGSEMSTKVTPKADDRERVGNMCIHDGKLMIIEYFELPDELAHARNPDGTRKFDAGSLAMHLLNVDFVDRIGGAELQLPFRRAEKAVPFIDEAGTRQSPSKPNAVKLETFIGDALPMANNPLLLEVDRAEEFSPVKNATGVDSLETSRRDQIARACRWLESAGVNVPRKPDGQPDIIVEIAPSFALDAEDVKANRDRLPPLRAGEKVAIE